MAGRKPDPPFLVWHTPSGGNPAVGLVHRGVDGHSFPMMTRPYFPSPMPAAVSSSTMVPMTTTTTHMQTQAVYRVPGGQLPGYGLRPTAGQVSYVIGVPTHGSGPNVGNAEEEQKIREKLAKERDFHIQQQRLRDFHASAVGGDHRTADKLIRDVLGKLDEGQDSKRKQDRTQAGHPARLPKQDDSIHRPSVPQHVQKARDWSNLDDFRDIFSSHAVFEDGLPLWCQEGSPVPFLYTQIEEYVTRNGVIDTTLLYPILVSSGLSRETLGQIWSLANRRTPGLLAKSELYAVLALIALAQNACQITSLSVLHSLNQPPIPLLNQVVSQPPLQVQSTVIAPGHPAPAQPLLNQTDPSTDKIAVLEDDDEFDDFKSAHGITCDRLQTSTTQDSAPDSLSKHSIGSRLANHHLPSQPRIGLISAQPTFPLFKEAADLGEQENSSEEFSEFQRCTSLPNSSNNNSQLNSIPKDQQRNVVFNGRSTINNGTWDAGVTALQSTVSDSVSPSVVRNVPVVASASGNGDLLGNNVFEDKYSVLRNLDFATNVQINNIQDAPKQASDGDDDEFGDFHSGVIHSNATPSSECGSSNLVPAADALSYDWLTAPPCSLPSTSFQGNHNEFTSSQVIDSRTQIVANEYGSRPPFLPPSFANVPWSSAVTCESSVADGKTELPRHQNQTDSDDEFGDFITTVEFADLHNGANRKEGDSISLGSNFFKSKDIVSIESQSVSSLDLGIEHHSSHSKSSEEAIHEINRHGSVPSLDLKINVEFEDESEVMGISHLTLTTDHLKPFTTLEPSLDSIKGIRQDVRHNRLSDFTPVSEDRYSVIRSEKLMVTPDHSYEWQRCLNHCLQVIKDSVKTFNSISSSDVCKEVISSEEGENYLKNVMEIYRVACRISLAIKHCDIADPKLRDAIKNVEAEWNNLMSFIIGSPAFPPEDRFDFSHCTLDNNDLSNLGLACGVCLLNVKANLPESSSNGQLSDFKLSYGGRHYHSTCANFWVNFVDSLLPALPFMTKTGS